MRNKILREVLRVLSEAKIALNILLEFSTISKHQIIRKILTPKGLSLCPFRSTMRNRCSKALLG